MYFFKFDFDGQKIDVISMPFYATLMDGKSTQLRRIYFVKGQKCKEL